MSNRQIKSIVFVLAGAFFLIFSNGRWSFPLAAWLYPLFLLQVSRRPGIKYSYISFPLITGFCAQVSFWNFTYDSPANIVFYLPFMLGLVYGLIFYIDRLLYSGNARFGVTLYFPLLYTSIDFINNLVNPFGTTGILGYSQFGFLSFAQLASITGMWGLTFMITWFGSVITWCADNLEYPLRAKKGVMTYAVVFIMVVSYGGIRLIVPLEKSTVRIAGIHTHDKDKEGVAGWKSLENKDIAGFKKISNDDIGRLVAATTKEAIAGASIVVWSEVSPKILKMDEDSLINKCRALAKQLKIYLLVTPFLVHPDSSMSENKILLFSPEGKIVLTHYKYGGNFMEGSVEGDKKIKAIETPYGKLSAVICWDADFPSTCRQVGKLQAGILLNPSSDWLEIDPLHSVVAIFRGIENGCSVVRQNRNGLSIITDPRGKIISQMDHFQSNSWVMAGQVPNKKIWTLYPYTGDIFGWLSFISLLGLLAVHKKLQH